MSKAYVWGSPEYAGGAGKVKPTKSIEDRLLEKIFINPQTGCWEWLAAKDGKGYGKMGINGKHQQAHRLMYELKYGKIPKGMFACHTCDNKSCCNPDHIFIGTNSDNIRDAIMKNRINYGKKLNSQLVREIYLANGTLNQIATQYNISFQMVSLIKNRKTWINATEGL